jgi:tRNA A37 threonylcarbamoyladenosine dehydratase
VKTFFSDAGFERLQDAYVIVVGLGGVGSHCSNMLVRSGVGRVRLIDFDQVTLSSLNRHALACMSDVGASKAEVLKRRLLEAVPWCKIEAVTQMFREEDATELILGSQVQSSQVPQSFESSQNCSHSQSFGGSEGSQGPQFPQRPCMVVDCIDDISTKAQLLSFCLQHDLPVVTSMGAGGKADPTKLRIAPLSECINDPLAQKLRWKVGVRM